MKDLSYLDLKFLFVLKKNYNKYLKNQLQIYCL